MLKFLVLTMCFVSSTLWAQTVSESLNIQIENLQKKIGSGSFDTMALSAYKNGARNVSFQIQGIARMFDKEKKVFKDLKSCTKEFEDHIGIVEKWNDLSALPNISAAQKIQYKTNYETELKNLADYLKASNFKSTISGYARQVALLKISEETTKKIVLAGIKDEINDVLKKKYDFTYGETGLHEMRRNVRWPLIEFGPFTSLFSVTKSVCKPSEFYKMGVKSPFIFLKENANASYNVDYCAYIELIGAVEYIGKVKDELERKGVLDQKVSPEIFALSKRILQQLKRDILPHLL
jgi:hypothetical protein